MATYANHPSIRPADFHTLQTELVSLCITHNVNPRTVAPHVAAPTTCERHVSVHLSSHSRR